MMVRLWALVLVLLASPLSAQTVEAGGGFFVQSDAKDCHTDTMYLNQMFGWQVSWPRVWQALANAPEGDVRSAIERWHTAAAALDADRTALARTGSGPGAAPPTVVDRVLEQVGELRAKLQQGPPPLASTMSPDLRQQWDRMFANEILPSVQRYETFLKNDYRPSTGAPGLAGTRDGVQCFHELVEGATTVSIAPQDIERKGWELLRQTERDIAKLNGIPQSRLPSLLEKLRVPRDRNFTESALVARSENALVRAKGAMPHLFARPLVRDVRIEPLPKAMEASFTAGFYREGPPGQPAKVVLNLSRPADRELMAEVIAFHEGLPGHHADVGLDYPRGDFNSGFIEGWAVYAEYLADEAGLYGSKYDRTGMMAKHLWAASRLIVEPGLHVHGWSRDRAVAFLRKHTPLSDAEINLEVDRYLSTPGQSLSYMLGYDRIVASRRYAKAQLGRSFNLRAFHDVILSKGSRPLDQVQADVVAWVKKVKAKKAGGA